MRKLWCVTFVLSGLAMFAAGPQHPSPDLRLSFDEGGGIAVMGARARLLGSLWIAWMAVLGGAMYGGASLYVVLTHDRRVSPLFAIGSSLMALWFLLVGLWPVRATPPFPVSLASDAAAPHA